MSRRSLLVGAGLGAGVLATSAVSGALSGPASAAGGTPGPVDVGFFTDMAVHHAQALAMCQRVLGADTGGPVQAAAGEILQNQAYETGLMHAWLQSWGESTAPPEEVMGWMHTPVAADQMIGLATPEAMAELAELEGRAKGRRFLELMRAHHEGGLHMASFAANHAETELVRETAARMTEVQSYEIARFDDLLAGSYA